jgi:hypothetical protein
MATTLGAYSGPQQIMNLYDSLPPYSSLFFFRVPNENTWTCTQWKGKIAYATPSWASLLYTFALFFHVSTTTNIFLHTNSISTNELLSGLESNSFIDLKRRRTSNGETLECWRKDIIASPSPPQRLNIIIRPLHNELIMVILVRK